MNMQKRWIFFLLALLSVAVAVLCLGIGRYHVGVGETLEILLSVLKGPVRLIVDAGEPVGGQFGDLKRWPARIFHPSFRGPPVPKRRMLPELT